MAYAVIDSTECFSLVQDSKIVSLPSSKTEITTGKQIFSIATSKNNVHRKVS